jgi:hypothetical protein
MAGLRRIQSAATSVVRTATMAAAVIWVVCCWTKLLNAEVNGLAPRAKVWFARPLPRAGAQ